MYRRKSAPFKMLGAWREEIESVETGRRAFGSGAGRLLSMRLNDEQRKAIIAATAELAGGDARVRLFGSRVHDDLRGGDIDLLIECPRRVERPVRLAVQLTARLQRVLGDRKIDVLVIDPDTLLEPVHRAAQVEGILL